MGPNPRFYLRKHMILKKRRFRLQSRLGPPPGLLFGSILGPEITGFAKLLRGRNWIHVCLTSWHCKMMCLTVSMAWDASSCHGQWPNCGGYWRCRWPLWRPGDLSGFLSGILSRPKTMGSLLRAPPAGGIHGQRGEKAAVSKLCFGRKRVSWGTDQWAN